MLQKKAALPLALASIVLQNRMLLEAEGGGRGGVWSVVSLSALPRPRRKQSLLQLCQKVTGLFGDGSNGTEKGTHWID